MSAVPGTPQDAAGSHDVASQIYGPAGDTTSVTELLNGLEEGDEVVACAP